MTVLVTGATGNIGRRTVDHLLAAVGGEVGRDVVPGLAAAAGEKILMEPCPTW